MIGIHCHLLAMYCDRANCGKVTLTIVMILCLINKLDHTACHLWHLTFHRWPSIILKLRNFDCILHLAIGHIKLASRVIRTTLALHVLDQYMIVLNFIVGPVAWAFFWSVADLSDQNNFQIYV